MKYPAAFLCAAVAAFFLFLCSGAVAEIYKYVDENGQTHYTNSPEAIPPQYRKAVDKEQEIKSLPTAPSQSPAVTGAPATNVPGGKNTGPGDLGAGKVAELRAREQAIQKEFEALKVEQAELLKAREAAVTNEEIEVYHQKMALFEERFDAFHEKRKAFEKEAREYNEKVRQDIEKALQDLKEKEKKK
ncbi:MAG: DUF4124 domain-containing protein [Thermodesulfobacteriota bacterium]